MTHVVYRHFNEDGKLLYVGTSRSLLSRTNQHKHTSHWFDQIANISVTHFPSELEAWEAEKLAIQTEAPEFNSRHNPAKKPKPPFVPVVIKHHKELDVVKAVYDLSEQELKCALIAASSDIGEIRESGRPLTLLEVIVLKNSLGTTFKRLSSIGIERKFA